MKIIMKDLQRDRLKHLLANAIMELWKKETGSMSAVLIEATICITSGNGKTTVLQVADKFGGSIPEVEDDNNNTLRQPLYPDPCLRYSLGPHSPLVPHKYIFPPKLDVNHIYNGNYVDNMSPCSLVSPRTERERRDSSPKRLRRDPSPQGLRRDNSPQSIRRDNSPRSVRQDSSPHLRREISPRLRRDSSPRQRDTSPQFRDPSPQLRRGSPQCSPDRRSPLRRDSSPRRRDSSPRRRDSSPHMRRDVPMDTSTTSREDEGSDSGSDVPNTPANKRDRPGAIPGYYKQHSSPHSETSPQLSALNLSSCSDRTDEENTPSKRLCDPVEVELKRDDLAISSPSSYTAQVRDVIRQRLLASKANNKDEGLDRQDSGRTPSPSRVELPRSSPSGVFNHLPPSMTIINGQLMHRSLSGALVPAPIPLVGQPTLDHSMLPLLKHKPDIRTPSPLPNQDNLSPKVYPGQVSPSLVSPIMASPGLPCNMASPNLSSSLEDSTDSSPDKDANGEQKVYKCPYCNKTFLFKSKYHEHLPVHTNARPFQCHLCSRTYKYKYDLRVHLRTHMGIPTKSTVCPFCNVKFETNKLLRLHIKDAHRDKQKVAEEECTGQGEHLPPAL